MAIKRTRMNIQFGQEYYETTGLVTPQGAYDSTDIMLVQFFVLEYFFQTQDQGISHQKTRFNTIWKSDCKTHFVDGIYGPATREALLLFEQATLSPYKDGIVRPICDERVVFAESCTYSTATKLEKMNWNFNRSFDSVTDKRSEVDYWSPPLFKKLFG